MAPEEPAAGSRFTVIVDTLPTALQTDALVVLPDRPLVQRNVRQRTGQVVFERTGADLFSVAQAAIRDLAAVGLHPVRVVHDDWVTLADIADRVGRSREAIRLWATGRVGPGGFPPPVNPGCDTSFYSWVEVSTWLRERLAMRVRAADAGLVVADLVVRLTAMGVPAEFITVAGSPTNR